MTNDEGPVSSNQYPVTSNQWAVDGISGWMDRMIRMIGWVDVPFE